MRSAALSAVVAPVTELVLYATLVACSLLYSRLFSDNVLAKGGVLLVGSGGLVALLALRAAGERLLPLPRLPIWLPWALLFGWSLVSALTSVNVWLGLESLLTYSAPLAAFWAAVALGRRPAAIQRLIWVVVGVSMVVSVAGLLQFAGFAVLPMDGQDRGVPVSTLGNPNFAAYYQVLVLPLLAALLLSGWRRLPLAGRLVVALAAALSVAHLLVSDSRGGWLSAVVSLLVLLRLIRVEELWTRRTVNLVVIGLLLLVIGEAFLQSVPLGPDRSLYDTVARMSHHTWGRARTALESSDFSRSMRLLIWRDTLGMIPEAPVLGVGPGQYWQALSPHIDRTEWNRLIEKRTHWRIEPRHAENEYLEFAVELGLVGLALLVWLYGALLWFGFTRLRAGAGAPGAAGFASPQAISAGVLCGILGVMLHALTGFNLHHPVVTLHLWLLAGVMVALLRQDVAANGAAGGLRLHGTRAAAAGVIGLLVAAALGITGLRLLIGEYYYERGGQHVSAMDARAAIDAFSKAARWRGHNFEIYRVLGGLALNSGRDPEARLAFERSLALQPQDSGALAALGGILVRQQDPGAVEVLQRAVRADRSNSQAQAMLGQAYRQAGKADSAQAVLERARQDWPKDPRLATALALVYRDRGDLQQAAAVLEAAAADWPDDGLVAGNLGAVYLDLRRGAEAERQLRKAVLYHPAGRTEWLADLSQALAIQGRYQEARQALAGALSRSPGDKRLEELSRTLTERAGQ